MSRFYEENLSTKYLGQMSPQNGSYRSDLVQLNFNMDQRDQPLVNRGMLNQQQFTVVGGYQPLNELFPNQNGILINEQTKRINI